MKKSTSCHADSCSEIAHFAVIVNSSLLNDNCPRWALKISLKVCSLSTLVILFVPFSLWLHFGIVKLNNLAPDNVRFSAICLHSSNAVNRESIVKYRLPVVVQRNSLDKKASYSLILSILFFSKHKLL